MQASTRMDIVGKMEPTRTDITNRLESVKDIQTGFIMDSPYLRTRRIKFTQNGRNKFWDFLDTTDSVSILVFNVTRRVVVILKMFRPALFFHSLDLNDQAKTALDLDKYNPSLGYSRELIAGTIEPDKQKILLAVEEVYSNTGYRISINELEVVEIFRRSVRVTGSLRTTYYCEVTDQMKVGPAGGADDKISDYVEMTIPEVVEMVTSPGPHNCSSSLLFSLTWFLHYKARKYCHDTHGTAAGSSF